MRDESTPMPARAYDATIESVSPEGEIAKIPVPGTSVVLEIDEAALAEQAKPEDFPFADSHSGDNYGKPSLRRG